MELGAQEITASTFIQQLQYYLKEKPDSFKQKSELWHTVLMESLEYALMDQKTLLNEIKNFKIIPVCKGSWSSAMSPMLFLPDGSGHDIPSSIGLEMVKGSLSSNPSLFNLCSRLGIRFSNPHEVCSLIIKQHEQAEWCRFTKNQLLEQSVYLFRAGFQPTSDDSLFFFRSLGHTDKVSLAALPFGDPGNFLRQTFGYDNRWVSWLDECYDKPTEIENSQKNEWHK
jgi:hypothetical protein